MKFHRWKRYQEYSCRYQHRQAEFPPPVLQWQDKRLAPVHRRNTRYKNFRDFKDKTPESLTSALVTFFTCSFFEKHRKLQARITKHWTPKNTKTPREIFFWRLFLLLSSRNFIAISALPTLYIKYYYYWLNISMLCCENNRYKGEYQVKAENTRYKQKIPGTRLAKIPRQKHRKFGQEVSISKKPKHQHRQAQFSVFGTGQFGKFPVSCRCWYRFHLWSVSIFPTISIFVFVFSPFSF